jgi:hypothetical protein
MIMGFFNAMMIVVSNLHENSMYFSILFHFKMFYKNSTCDICLKVDMNSKKKVF